MIDLVAGARPNFVKLAAVVQGLNRYGRVPFRVVHTGQHYDAAMSDTFFEQLEIPQPDVHLGVGSGTQGAQTARILEQYERHLLERKPVATVVFGDVNSTVACALAAAKLQIKIVHVEAGLRSFDRTMPEEINRIVTDALSDLLLVSESSGLTNLEREGIPSEKVRLVGNVMIDSLMRCLPAARRRPILEDLGLSGQKYGYITLHRPSNVDDPQVLETLLQLFISMAKELPLVFPIHPRTRAVAEANGLAHLIRPDDAHLRCVPPLPYLDSIAVTAGASVVFTDSGGLQEETAILGVPCVTLRENTERPITVEFGTSRLVGRDLAQIAAAFRDIMDARWRTPQAIPLWDGRAGDRVASEIASWLGIDRGSGPS